MARVKGCAGSVLIGTSTVGATGIREWTLDYTVSILDGRGFDDACEPNPVVGMKTWEGNFRGFKDGAPISTLFTDVAITLKESTTAGQVWSGSVIITGIHPRVAVDGLVEYAYDFIGKGTLTVATA